MSIIYYSGCIVMLKNFPEWTIRNGDGLRHDAMHLSEVYLACRTIPEFRFIERKELFHGQGEYAKDSK
jgi:hypothetical protein